jgi:hypothetical protein
MPPLDILSPVPVLVLGALDQLRGEVWLSNTSGSEVKLEKATLTVTISGPPETGTIQIPPDTTVAVGASKRLSISFGIEPFTTPGTYPASVDLDTSAGTVSIPATLIIERLLAIGFTNKQYVFTGVSSASAIKGSVVVVNRGNVAFAVTAIPDEALFELVPVPRIVAVANDGEVSVTPAPAMTPVSGTLQFTNDTPTIAVGGWAEIGYEMTTPAGLPAAAHLRALPRIGPERFSVDLLT